MSSYRLAFLFKYCKKRTLLLSDTNSVHFIEFTTVRKHEKIFNQKKPKLCYLACHKFKAFRNHLRTLI